ncbi:cell division protein FtsZ [Nitrosopumilus sp.]|uniref:cell division protein FtsZ n=1 Tax=Nitrosopumilus sp. TaxID=2024843 RepID=UPI003B5B20AB
MSVELKEPVLVIGLGGAGSKLAKRAKKSLDSECLTISNDNNDFSAENKSIHISTKSIINPSVQLIRGSTYQAEDEIKSEIARYSTIILISNLAGKAGSAMAPAISDMCKELEKTLISFAIMPFKFEKDRIFNSGITLRRLREKSECTVVLDNDSLLESNPDLNVKTCYEIGNSAMMHVIKSLKTTKISEDNILTTSKDSQKIEESLRDSLKMLYGETNPSAIKSAILYVTGGSNIPIGVINSITNLTNGIVNESNTQVDTTSTSEESKVVMLSAVQGMRKFDSYDPLNVIPEENQLDWSSPECSIDYKLDLYQLE